MTADPLSVQCPECRRPAGDACESRYSDATHQERQRLADLRALEKGLCALCGQFMVRGSVLGSPVDAWHPDEDDAASCPKMPDPITDWPAHAAKVNLGRRAGYPGLEHFRATEPPAGSCPECLQGKHANCTHTIPVGDGPEVVPCRCLAIKHGGS